MSARISTPSYFPTLGSASVALANPLVLFVEPVAASSTRFPDASCDGESSSISVGEIFTRRVRQFSVSATATPKRRVHSRSTHHRVSVSSPSR